MKKFISTLLCIVFAAALMPAQIAKADSDYECRKSSKSTYIE